MNKGATHSANLHPALQQIPPLVGLFLLGGVWGRLLYETAFPALSVSQSHLLGWATAVGLLVLWLRFVPHTPHNSLASLPLWINGWYLFQPQTSVNLLAGWLVLALSLYTAVFSANLLKHHAPPRTQQLLWLLLPLAAIYWLTLGRTVGQADTFEFQVVVPQLGIVHPTGYPLYLLLGKLWTLLIPVGQVAWRLNVGTAVYALLTAAILYLLSQRLLSPAKPPLLPTTAALAATFAFALSPTFWSQAIAAEVYTLHNFFVALILLLTLQTILTPPPTLTPAFVLLAFLLGLGLTNHLTTVILFPAVGLALLFRLWADWPGWGAVARLLAKMALAFALPLALYAYLPLRWQAVNNEPMGLGRFVGWVTGSQFQGALQLRAWLADPTRYEVLGRLFLAEWSWWGLALAGLGLVFLARRNGRVALILAVTWLGFAFYALNYYVPDLNVFLLPAHLVTAVFLAAGLVALVLWTPLHRQNAAVGLLPLLLLLPLGADVVQTWPQVDQSQQTALVQWGTAVLDLPLAPEALILADSEKIAPLYYLQQAEGVRPDLDIMVLPDEATYRAELDGRLAAGQTVYLARFLPGLEGIYHLRSAGPLTEVSTQPLTSVPPEATPTDLTIGSLSLLGYTLEPVAAVDETATAVTFYWQAPQPVGENVR
ncbi:MAG: DUF2723 domain-containing protein, partial [Anaerolineales bacterium]|nr:DUF2723 domain-containing protein [Anaerolineales bacterium]